MIRQSWALEINRKGITHDPDHWAQSHVMMNKGQIVKWMAARGDWATVRCRVKIELDMTDDNADSSVGVRDGARHAAHMPRNG